MEIPNSIIESAITIIFYLIMAGFAFLSFIALYSLYKFAESKIAALFMSTIYIFLAVGLFATSVYYLSQINF